MRTRSSNGNDMSYFRYWYYKYQKRGCSPRLAVGLLNKGNTIYPQFKDEDKFGEYVDNIEYCQSWKITRPLRGHGMGCCHVMWGGSYETKAMLAFLSMVNIM